jgi:hypothetical protein
LIFESVYGVRTAVSRQRQSIRDELGTLSAAVDNQEDQAHPNSRRQITPTSSRKRAALSEDAAEAKKARLSEDDKENNTCPIELLSAKLLSAMQDNLSSWKVPRLALQTIAHLVMKQCTNKSSMATLNWFDSQRKKQKPAH